MRAGATGLLLAALVLPALGGCAVIAVGSAVVGVGVAAVETTYAVGKGAVKVATYPFRDSDEEKEQKRLKEQEEQQGK
jgi:curli biogenesis system outer membrane secretion channel CsgG